MPQGNVKKWFLKHLIFYQKLGGYVVRNSLEMLKSSSLNGTEKRRETMSEKKKKDWENPLDF